MTSRVKNNASLSIPPRTAVLVEIPLLARVLPGSMFTVAVVFAEKDNLVSVAAGRVAKTHFPIESWPKSDECPYPTINDSNYEFVQSHGFDTYFFTQNPCHTSKAVGQKILCDLAPKYNFYGLVDDGVPLDDCANASMALGIFIADEADKAVRVGKLTTNPPFSSWYLSHRLDRRRYEKVAGQSRRGARENEFDIDLSGGLEKSSQWRFCGNNRYPRHGHVSQ